ncbi:MAG: shikimate dehydrogenase [Gemmatimonadota bacterium]
MSVPAKAPARPGVTSATRVFALLGDPVGHSRSPVIQNEAFGQAEVDGVYVAMRCRTEDLASVLRTLALTGGGGNVTLPHKERAARLLDVPSDAVRRTGACNTFWGTGDAVHGDNTDVEGFRRAVKLFLEGEGKTGSLAGARILLLGAGGASRAVLVSLLDEAAGSITLLNRSAERARAVARRIGGASVRVAEGVESLKDERFDLVVNATRLGLSADDPLPLDLGVLESADAVFDLVYGAAETPFVRSARERGVPAVDGAEMLVQQGAVAFERWWERPAPIGAMRAALDVGS